MSDFRSRLITAIESSPYKGNRNSLSKDIGKGSRYISNLLNNPNPNMEPGLNTSRRIAECLGVSLTYLAGMEDEVTVSGDRVSRGSVNMLSEKILDEVMDMTQKALGRRRSRPTIDDMVDWWHASGGRLENIEAIADCIDIHHRPSSTDTVLKLGSLGRNSLAAQAMGSDDPDVLRRSLETITGNRMARLLTDYGAVAIAELPVSIEQVTVVHPETKQRIHLNYKRLLMPVRDDRGQEMIVNYSQLL